MQEHLAYTKGRTFAGQIPAWPMHDAQEEQAVLDVVRSGCWWRGSGSEVDRFEDEFSAFVGVTHTRAVGNGTQAIELALACAGIRAGDEVIVPASTFIATASAVLTYGAVPIPVDVDGDTLCIDPNLIEAAVTPRTRAIIPVHMAGQICDMDRIGKICKHHGLVMIEDAAHAHGARWKGRAAGTFGELAIFSFQNGKLMTAGEGGALCTSDPRIAERTFALHSCGRPKGDTEYDHQVIASNLRMSELQGAVLRVQLRRLPDQLAVRERGARLLTELLSGVPGVRPLARRAEADVHSWYMYMFEIDPAAFGGDDAGAVAAALRVRGITAYRCFPPVNSTTMFARKTLDARGIATSRGFLLPDYERIELPIADAAYRRIVWLHHALLLAEPSVLAGVADELHNLQRARLTTAAVPA